MTRSRFHLHLASIVECVLLIALTTVHAQVAMAEQFIIDRMVAVVDGDVVTLGDIENFRLLGQFFGDVVPDADSDVLDRLIENILIARQIGQFQRAPIEDVTIDGYLEQFGDSDALAPDLLRREARNRIERAIYFDSIRRFAPVTQEELLARYEDDFVPELRARGVEVIPPLFEVEDELSEVIRDIKLNEEIDARVERLYRSYQVEVVD